MTRVLFFVPEFIGLDNAVLQAQVGGQARALAAAGNGCMLLARSDAAAVPIEGFDRIETVPAGGSGGFAATWWAARGAARSTAAAEFAPDIVYTRSVACSGAGRSLARRLGARHVHDVRGLSAAEYALKGGRGPAVALLSWIERREIARAEHLICVSHRLADRIRAATGRAVEAVVPCSVDVDRFAPDPEARAALRAGLGWAEDAPVVVYCGGMSRWQKIDAIVSRLAAACERLSELRLLFLTPDPEGIAGRLSGAGVPADRFHARSVPSAAVPSHLAAADMGIVLRDDIAVNNVASPIKIAEYLACGLPVIASPGIGDYSAMLEAEDLGVLIDPEGDADTDTLDDFIRTAAGRADAARAHAVAHLAWGAHADIYERIRREGGAR